jgi:hypothetical protein
MSREPAHHDNNGHESATRDGPGEIGGADVTELK